MRCRYSHCPQLTDKVNVLFGLMPRSKCQDGISCIRDLLGKGGAEAEWSPGPTGQVWWLGRRVGEECPGLQGSSEQLGQAAKGKSQLQSHTGGVPHLHGRALLGALSAQALAACRIWGSRQQLQPAVSYVPWTWGHALS